MIFDQEQASVFCTFLIAHTRTRNTYLQGWEEINARFVTRAFRAESHECPCGFFSVLSSSPPFTPTLSPCRPAPPILSSFFTFFARSFCSTGLDPFSWKYEAKREMPALRSTSLLFLVNDCVEVRHVSMHLSKVRCSREMHALCSLSVSFSADDCMAEGRIVLTKQRDDKQMRK